MGTTRKQIAICVGAVATAALGSSALACPDFGLYGELVEYTSDDLYTEQRLDVTAGGDIDLNECLSMPGYGWVIEAPDFTIQYTRTGPYTLRFRTEAAEGCDTVLLLNDAAGEWYFDDDSATPGDGVDAQIMVVDAVEGFIDVWVGTYEPESCAASLFIESFDQ